MHAFCLAALWLSIPASLDQSPQISQFPQLSIEEISVVRVFRDRVLFRGGDREAMLKIGEVIGRERWQMKSCHPNRITFESASGFLVLILQTDGTYSRSQYSKT